MAETVDIARLLRARRFWLVLILLWAAAYLPSLGVRDLRLEEGRRATPAREMLVTGDLVTPRLYGDVYLSKPPGFFWIIAGVGQVTGSVSALATRIPSVLAVLAAAVIVLGFGKRDLSRDARALAALMLLSVSTLLDKGTVGEIDTLLSTLVFAALTVFYAGYTRGPQAPSRRTMLVPWLVVGALGAGMVLLKGPGGVIETAVPIAAFLIWEKQWRHLFSLGALAAVVLTVLPGAVWVWLLQRQGAHDLVGTWSDQMGAKAAGDALTSTTVFTHYLWVFPASIAGMTLPWLIWAAPALAPREARAAGMPPRLWRFLVCAAAGIVLPFYLWPASQGRYAMAVAFPVCVLAAAYIVGDEHRERPAWTRRLVLGVASVLAAVPIACGIAAVGLAYQLYRPGIPVTIALAAGGLFATLALARFVQHTRKHTPARAGLALAATLAIALLSGRALASAVLIPWKSHTDQTRVVGRALAALLAPLPPDRPLYTMRTFPTRKSDGYYNIQFYAGPRLRALHTAEELSRGVTVTVIGTRADIDALAAANIEIRELGTTPVRDRLPPLIVTEARRP